MSQQLIPMRVLVIDDDPTIRELLALLLERESYVVESADSGETALALLGRNERAFDLVLADVQMPGMPAAELARKLRLACGPATGLLAISGSQPSAHVTSLFDGFLLKPFKLEDVTAGLRTRHSTHSPVARMENEAPEPHTAETADSKSTVPVLNEIIYTQLANSIPALQLQEMYALCISDARKRIARMLTLVATRDSEQFIREAHSMKGGCGMLGATELHLMTAELETNGLQSSPAGAARDVNSLEQLFAACDRLERMLKLRV